MAVIKIDVAQGTFENALAAVERGDEVLLIRDGRPMARMLPATAGTPWTSTAVLPDRVPGTARGLVTIRDDFDDPLEDFRGYL